MGLLTDLDPMLLGASILANNTGHYGALAPALGGGLLQYNKARSLSQEMALRQQEQERRNAILEQQQKEYDAALARQASDQSYWEGIGLGNAPQSIRDAIIKRKYAEPKSPTLKEVFDADSPTGSRWVTAEDAIGMAGKGKSGLSVTLADGTVIEQGGYGVPGGMGKKALNTVESNIVDTLQFIPALNQIAANYNDEHLSLMGRAKGKYLKGKDIVNPEWTDAQDEAFISQHTKLRQATGRLFNAYRKEVTGAAAAVSELKLLMQDFLNKDMGPAEFKASYESFVSLIEQQIQLNRELKNQGYTQQEISKALDNQALQFTGGGDNDPLGLFGNQ